MPRTTAARKGAAPGRGAAQATPLSLASLSATRAAALDRLHRGRHSLEVGIGGQTWTLAPLWPVPEPVEAMTTVVGDIGGDMVGISLPSEVLADLVQAFAPEADLRRLDEANRLLVVEAALDGDLARLESKLDAQVKFAPAVAAAGPAEIAFQARVGERAFVVTLADVPAALLEHLAGHFGAQGRPSATVVDLPLPVRLCRDAVTLTLGELRSLAAGDVVMLDGEDGAFAIVADRLVAPLAIEPGRARLASQPVAIATSQWDWIMTETPPMPISGLEEGALDDVPVTVVFELARKTLAVSEIKTLTAGAIVGLPEVARETVDLVANGKRVGQGEIIRIGEGLGVRILSMSANAG